MITIIAGIPGAGKTLYLSYLAVNKILNGSFEDYINAKKEISYMNTTGFNLDLPPQKHLCFSDTPIKISKRISAYEIDGYKVALPNIYFETVTLPPYSTLFLDEAQRYYDSRFSKVLREDVYQWYQFHRKNHYNIFMTCQRLGNIDLNIRAIAEKCIVIDKCDIEKDKYGIVRKITWTMREFRSCETAERYQLQSDNKEVANLGELKTVSTTLPVFDYYDSYSHRQAFYAENSYTRFQYDFSHFYDISLEEIAEFNQKYSVKAPIGYYKNADYDKKIIKEFIS